MVSIERRILSSDDVFKLLQFLEDRRVGGNDESYRSYLSLFSGPDYTGEDSLARAILRPIRSLTIQLPIDPSLRLFTPDGELASSHDATHRLFRYMAETRDSLLPDLRTLTILSGETAPYCGKSYRVTFADRAAGGVGEVCLTGTLNSTETAIYIRDYLEKSTARKMHWHVPSEILQQNEAHITHCSNALPLPPDLRHLEISMPILPFLPAEILQSADQPAKEVKERVKRRVLLEQIIARLQQMHGHPKILEIKGYCPFFREEPQAPTGGVDDGLGRREAVDLSQATDEERLASAPLCHVQDKAKSLVKRWLGDQTMGEPAYFTNISYAIDRLAGPRSRPAPADTPAKVYVSINSYFFAENCPGCGLVYASSMPFSPYAVIGGPRTSLQRGYITLHRVMRDVREALPVGDLA